MKQRNFSKYFLIFAGFTIFYVIFYSLQKTALEKEFLTATTLVPSIRDFGSGTVSTIQNLAHTWGLLAGLGLGLIAWLVSLLLLTILKLIRLAKYKLANIIALLAIYGAYFVFATELLYYENRFSAISIGIIIFIGHPLYYAALVALFLIFIVYLSSLILEYIKNDPKGRTSAIVLVLLLVTVPFLSGCSWLGDLENVGCGASSNSTHCFQEAAVSSGNADECSKVSQPAQFKALGSNPPQDKCLLMVAENTGNTNICKNLKGGEMSYTQTDCVTSVAAATENIGDCQTLNGTDRQKCLDQAAPPTPAVESPGSVLQDFGYKPGETISYETIKPGETTETRSGEAAFTSLSREVEISLDGGKSFIPAHPDTKLKPGMLVRTSEDSSAIIGFGDLSTFELKPESTILITTPPATDSKIKLVLGNIWINVKKMAKNGTMEVDMSQAVAGIKATTLVLHEDGKNSTLKVIDGTVAFTSKADKKTTLIATGETIAANKSGSQVKQTFDVAAETKSWENVGGASKWTLTNIIIWAGAGVVAVLLLIIGYLKFVKKRI